MPAVAKKKPVKKAASAKPKLAGGTVSVRVFRNGRSNAIRIPAALDLGCKEIDVTPTDDGRLILSAKRKLTGKEFWAELDAIRDSIPGGFDFVRPPQGEFEKREPLFD